MVLVKHKIYPDYYNYDGRAYQARIVFHSVRLPYFDDVVNWISTEAVEAQIWLKKGVPLELKIYAVESSWHGIPTYIWTVEWSYYMRTLGYGEESLGWSAVFYAVLALLTIIALVFLFKQIKEIIWGSGVGPVNGGLVGEIGKLIIYGSLSFAGVYLLVNYLRRKK